MARFASAASLWLVWVVASLLGLAVASWVSFHVSGRVLFGLRKTGLDPQFSGLFLIPVQHAIFGAGLGLAQWVVLQRYLSRVGWWPAATALGTLAAAPFVIIVALVVRHLLTPPEAIVYAVLTGCVTGTLIAVAQMTVLNSKGASFPLWPAAGLAGYGLGTVTTMAMSVFLYVPYDSLFGPATGAIAGAITGVALLRIVGKELPPAISASTARPG